MSIKQAIEALEELIEYAETAGFDWSLDNARAALAALRSMPQGEPVLIVEKEPDYWSGGHFYQGKKPWIDPFKVYALPIGTNLYTAP